MAVNKQDLLPILDYINPSQLEYSRGYSVYKHTTPNQKVYIGITGLAPEDRWDSGHGYSKHKYFWNAIKKYGWNNITHEVIYDNLTKEEACLLEISLIDMYDSTNPLKGYNLSTGGKGGSTGTILSEETRNKMSLSRTSEKHPMYGKHHSTITKNKLSQIMAGKNHPQFGTHRSESTKEKLHNANSGEKHPFYGKHLTDKARKKIGEKSAIKVVCVETGIVYSSATEAALQTGINPSHISACCRKVEHRKTSGGYHWSHVDGGEVSEQTI